MYSSGKNLHAVIMLQFTGLYPTRRLHSQNLLTLTNSSKVNTYHQDHLVAVALEVIAKTGY